MNKTAFKVAFFLRKEKPLKTRELPISIRITLNGERVSFNGKHNVKPCLSIEIFLFRQELKFNASENTSVFDTKYQRLIIPQ